MYIGEVVRRAQSYCPSEYDTREMYLWCDEVSSMLAIEDRNVFVKTTLLPDEEGRVLLPDNVKFENVISVTANGIKLRKEDLRSAVCQTGKKSSVDIVYLMPYKPIRAVSYKGDVTVDKSNSSIICTGHMFEAGDSINFTSGEVTMQLQVSEVSGDTLYILNSVEELPDSCYAEMERIVTEKTICDAPYDVMYVDYIIAKICMYQRDFNTYNQFMSSFNARLDAYKRWITNQLPQSGGEFKNWW